MELSKDYIKNLYHTVIDEQTQKEMNKSLDVMEEHYPIFYNGKFLYKRITINSYVYSVIFLMFHSPFEIKEDTTIKKIWNFVDNIVSNADEHKSNIEPYFLIAECLKQFCIIEKNP